MIKIGISSGHNKDNVNASPDGKLLEWEINLKIKKKVAKRLKVNGFNYIDLNPERMGYDLQDRSDIANNHGVSAVVAIHCNAWKGFWGNWGGIESYAHPLAPARGGKLLAQKVHNRLIQGTPLIDRGVKLAKFAILGLCKAPSVLVELGFMDNRREAALLLSEEYQDECATEIVQGLCDYFKKKYKPLDTYDDNYKDKYIKLKKLYEEIVNKNENDTKIIKKVKDYIEQQVAEMDYVSRKYFD